MVGGLAPIEARDSSGEIRDELGATIDVEDPVEEVLLDNSVDLSLVEAGAAGDVRGRQTVVGQIKTGNGVRDSLGSQNEQGLSLIHI